MWPSQLSSQDWTAYFQVKQVCLDLLRKVLPYVGRPGQSRLTCVKGDVFLDHLPTEAICKCLILYISAHKKTVLIGWVGGGYLHLRMTLYI